LILLAGQPCETVSSDELYYEYYTTHEYTPSMKFDESVWISIH
jgi:hypothetical protein